MSDVYRRLGVRTVVNAAGTLTRLGGSRMAPEVLAAMAEAARAFVRIEDLQERAGEIIAAATGAEAGYVTSGAAAGLLLGTAACVAGLDIARMDRLPDTNGMPNEVIVQRQHRHSYDHAIRTVGVRLVEVGGIGHPGPRPTYPWELEAAITGRTAATAWTAMHAPGALPLADVVRIAHRHRVPVLVDATGALPPPENLRTFTSAGADLVSFSGGKALGGPQCSGILAGRRDLIQSVALQHQDMDVHPQTWTWRRRFLDSGSLPGPPLQGIGRPMKVGREEIVGLLTALDLYLQRDHAADHAHWRATVQRVAAALDGLPGVWPTVTALQDRYPLVRIQLDEVRLGRTAFDAINRLLDGDPIVAVGEAAAAEGVLIVNPINLTDDDTIVLIERLRAVLAPVEG
jgi:L-seryl-tRNA(Ser) seleniumtransferase